MFPLLYPCCSALPVYRHRLSVPIPARACFSLLPNPWQQVPSQLASNLTAWGCFDIIFLFFSPAISPPSEAGDDKVATGNWPQICLPQHSTTPLPLPLIPPPIAFIPCGSLSHLELGPEFPSPPCVSRCERGRPV